MDEYNNLEPFLFPTCYLEKGEYHKIITEINTNYYDRYSNIPFGIHYSLGLDGVYYVYFFENHGYNNYNIYGKFLI